MLGDYFSRMGGAARPHNMAESEIQLYIACKLIKLHDDSFNLNKYLDSEFIDAAAPVIGKSNSYLSRVSLSLTDLFPFVLIFYVYADEKLKPIEKTKRWYLFGEYLKEKNA